MCTLKLVVQIVEFHILRTWQLLLHLWLNIRYVIQCTGFNIRFLVLILYIPSNLEQIKEMTSHHTTIASTRVKLWTTESILLILKVEHTHNMWKGCGERSSGGTSDSLALRAMLDSYLCEFMWRSCLQGADPFWSDFGPYC